MDSGSGPGSSSSGPMTTELFRCLYAACRVGVWQQMRSAEADCLTSAAASIVSSGAAAWGKIALSEQFQRGASLRRHQPSSSCRGWVPHTKPVERICFHSRLSGRYWALVLPPRQWRVEQ
jgi:hypothetical protein